MSPQHNSCHFRLPLEVKGDSLEYIVIYLQNQVSIPHQQPIRLDQWLIGFRRQCYNSNTQIILVAKCQINKQYMMR